MRKAWNTRVLRISDGLWTWAAWPESREAEGKGGVETSRESAQQAADACCPEDDAPPAWMVKVAREARALSAEEAGLGGTAANLRDGKQDEGAAMASHIRALRLALERGHVVEAREWTEEELLKAAREDAAQVSDGNAIWADAIRAGNHDDHDEVKCALQARRNMLKEGAVGGATKAPEVDLDWAVRRSWRAGFLNAAVKAKTAVADVHRNDAADADCDRAVSYIIAALPPREA